MRPGLRSCTVGSSKQVGLSWEGPLRGNISQFGPRVQAAMVAGAKLVEPQALAHMKNNAPWEDQTGNARNGLNAETVITAKSVAIVLFHTVPYGPYLELRWSGRYQIIVPTIEIFAPVLIDTIAELAFD